MTESDYDIIMFGVFFFTQYNFRTVPFSSSLMLHGGGRKKHKFTQLQQIKPVYRDRLFPLASIRVTYVTHCATRTKKGPFSESAGTLPHMQETLRYRNELQ